MGVIQLKKGGGRLLKSGGAWIFDNECEVPAEAIPDGSIVDVADFDGYPLGRGFWNSASKIRVRMLTRSRNQEINEDFLRMRVRNAWEYRKKTVDTEACRVIFGEADFLPGLTVDKYGDVLVVESLSLGMDRLKDRVLDILKEILLEDGIGIRGMYERSDSRERLKEGMERTKGFLGPEFDTQVEITENGIHYFVDVQEGQNRLLPGSEIQPPCHPEMLQRGRGARLLYAHRGFCAECGDGRCRIGARPGCFGNRDCAGRPERGEKSSGKNGPLRDGGCSSRRCRPLRRKDGSSTSSSWTRRHLPKRGRT